MAAARKGFSEHSNLSASAGRAGTRLGTTSLGDAEVAGSYQTYHIQ